MATEPDGAAIEAAIGDAIQRVIREHENGFTLRWVALVETADADGVRGAWTMTSPDAKPWDTLGLLEYGKQREAARIVEDRHRDD